MTTQDHSDVPVMSVMVRSPVVKESSIPDRWNATEAAVQVWLDSYRSENTRDAYRRDLRRWFEWCRGDGTDPGTARRADVDGYARDLDEEDLSSATKARRLAAVSSFYTYWMVEGVLDRNPAAHVRRPRVPDEPGSIALTRAQLQALVAYVDRQADKRAAIVVRLLAELGLRVSELCRAGVGDLGYSSGHHTLAVVRKGDVRATLPLPPRTADLIRGYVGDRASGTILVTASWLPVDRHYVRHLLRRLAREAGLEVWEQMHPHVLRHTVATLLDESGRKIQDIQRMLGHADPRTTQRYTHHRAGLDASPVYDLAGLLAA